MTHHPSERETAGAIDFDVALEGYTCGYVEREHLLRAAGLVIDSTLPLDPEHARAIAELTGATVKLATYDDAGHAVRRYFAAKTEGRHYGLVTADGGGGDVRHPLTISPG